MKTISILLCLFVIATGCRPSHDKLAQHESDANLAAMLEGDLALLDKQIAGAQDDVIEYARLNDVNRVQIRAEAERLELAAILAERAKFGHELIVLEAKYPALKDTNTISSVQDSVRDQHEELVRTLNALEMSEYNWKSKNLLAVNRDSKLRHLQDHVRRLEETYSQIAQRLHDLRMKEQLRSLQNQSPCRAASAK